MEIPSLSFGTYGMQDAPGQKLILQALEAGFRSFDTGQRYLNESEVGRAVAESGLPREDVFLATKIWVDNLDPPRLLASLEESREMLQTGCIDLVVIHWPVERGAVTIARALEALALAQQRGLARMIGVSNFTIKHMRQAVEVLGPGAIATNQIEIHPYFQNRHVAAEAAALGIHTTSFKTLAHGRALSDPTILSIARKRGATAAQVVLAWALALGHATVTSSSQRVNLEQNLLAKGLLLDGAEMNAIAGLERGERLTNPPALAPDWD